MTEPIDYKAKWEVSSAKWMKYESIASDLERGLRMAVGMMLNTYDHEREFPIFSMEQLEPLLVALRSNHD